MLKNKPAIDLLQSWMREDVTDDPEKIRRAEEEVEELKRNLNANRAATGERLVCRERHILLNSSPLGLLSSPVPSPQVIAITTWAVSSLAAGHRLYIPEVIDYELRRELLRAGKTTGLAKLEGLKTRFRYFPHHYCGYAPGRSYWAQSRRRGMPTGDPKKLDIDVILAAQALTLGAPSQDVTDDAALVTAVLALVSAHVTPTHRAAAARALDKELPKGA